LLFSTKLAGHHYSTATLYVKYSAKQQRERERGREREQKTEDSVKVLR